MRYHLSSFFDTSRHILYARTNNLAPRVSMLAIDSSLKDKKEELLAYFRSRATEALDEVRRIYGVKQFKEQASAINKAIVGARNTLVVTLNQRANWERWDREDVLRCILMITYVSYVVTIEARNEV
jgi:hypothetical protein